MKATELMIGDWVCLKDDIKSELPLKVDGVLIDDISLEGEGFLGGVDGLVRPISLTPEILEKNGFVELKLDEGSSTILWEYYPWNIEYDITNDEYYGMRGEIKIEYVHQLQHILRLYGENELADNFKI